MTSTYELDKKAAKTTANHKQRSPRGKILHANMQRRGHKIANVVDHMTAVAAVLRLDPLRPYAPTWLTRVAIEAAAGFAFLLDTSVDTGERILRAAGLGWRASTMSVLVKERAPYHHVLKGAPAEASSQ